MASLLSGPTAEIREICFSTSLPKSGRTNSIFNPGSNPLAKEIREICFSTSLPKSGWNVEEKSLSGGLGWN